MPASPSKLAQKRQATRAAILDATSQIIAENGVDGFAISAVARTAGINRSLIYHYFQNRDNLIAEAIGHILKRYRPAQPMATPDAVATGVKMYIDQPDIARFFYQLLLHGRPLLSIGERIRDAIAFAEALKQEHAPDADFDPAFGVISLLFVQISWAFSRDEFARLLGISVDEADRRIIAHLRAATSSNLPASASSAQ